MLVRGCGGILNVASAIAFQPAPYQAVYGASKAFVLSFSQALWAEARAAGVAVTALCPGPTRTGFVDALGADVGHTAIYRRLADPGPVIEAGLRGLDKGRAVVIPGVRNKLIAASGRLMPREWLARVGALLLGPVNTRAPIEVHNEIVIAASPERVWDVLTDVESWPSWYRACRWVRLEPSPRGASAPRATRAVSFRWKAHPVVLRSTVVAADRPHRFSIVADAQGLHAERTFTVRPAPDGRSSVVISHETQVGPVAWFGRAYLAPRLRRANQAMFEDLARAAGSGRGGARGARSCVRSAMLNVSNTTPLPPPPGGGLADARARILAMLRDSVNVGDASGRQFLEQAFDLLRTRLVRGHDNEGVLSAPVPRRGLANWQVKRVVSYMRDRLEQEIGLNELAALVNLSRFHFCTAFRMATGRTPHEWLTHERMARSRALLADPTLRITDIALSVGYGTPSAFAATFRKLVGQTPTQFRRQL